MKRSPQHAVFSGKASRLRGKTFVIGCFQDVRPLRGAAGEIDWLFGGLLSQLFVQKKMSGARGDSALLATQGKIPLEKVLLIGLGKKDRYDLKAFEEMVIGVLGRLDQMGEPESVLELLGIEECGLPVSNAMDILVRGVEEAGGRGIGFYVRNAERARELRQQFRMSPQWT